MTNGTAKKYSIMAMVVAGLILLAGVSYAYYRYAKIARQPAAEKQRGNGTDNSETTIKLYNFADCTYASVQDITAWLGGTVTQDASNTAYNFKRGDRSIVLSIGNEVLEFNNGETKKVIHLDDRCMLIDGRIYAPIDSVVYALGGEAIVDKCGVVTNILFDGKQAKYEYVLAADLAPQIDGIHMLVNFDDKIMLGGIDNKRWCNDDKIDWDMRRSADIAWRVTLFDTGGVIGKAEYVIEDRDLGFHTPIRFKREILTKDRVAGSKVFGMEELTWDPIPGKPAIINANDQHAQIAKETLKGIGINAEKINIVNVLSADIDGDSIREEIINASTLSDNSSDLEEQYNDCSVVMCAKPGMKTANIITGIWNTSNSSDVRIDKYSLDGIFDIDGDGKLELLIGAPYIHSSIKIRVYKYWQNSYRPIFWTRKGLPISSRGVD